MTLKKFTALFPFLLLLGLHALCIAHPKVIENLHLKTFDAFQQIQPRTYEEAPVAVIDIDDETLSRQGQWPWPRTQLAELVNKLHELGAATIALDIVFPEPDRTSPQNIIPLWKQHAPDLKLSQLLDPLPDHDNVFAQSLQNKNVVTGFSLVSNQNSSTPALQSAFAFIGENPTPYLPRFQGAVTNLSSIEEQASGNGSFNIIAEQDGIIRRVPLFFRLNETLYPSLVLESLRVAQGAKNFVLKTVGGAEDAKEGSHQAILSVKTGRLVIPTDDQGQLWLYDSGYQAQRFIPAWKILENKIDAKTIQGKIVYVGTSATGLKDIRTTPINPVAAGVEIHAQLTEQILLENYLKRPDWAPGAELLYSFCLGILLILLMQWVRAVGCAFIALIATAGVFSGSWYAFTQHGYVFDPVTPSLVVLIIYLSSSLLHYARTELERRHIRHAFSRYLSPDLVKNVVENRKQLKLGGETKEMSFLFADIRNFTSISEKLKAQELTKFINDFLTPMTNIILKNHGTIDKYMGDCIMAFWNAPIEDHDHASHAAQSALEMELFLEKWDRDIPFQIGIGINTGSACVGNMGSEQRFDYSVLGDDVNLASRLEGLCKVYGTKNIISESTAKSLPNFATLELDRVKVKGKNEATAIFTLVGNKTVKDELIFQQLHKKHHEMLGAYYSQKWDTALQLCKECTDFKGNKILIDGFYSYFQKRVEEFKTTPPPSDWEGISEIQTK